MQIIVKCLCGKTILLDVESCYNVQDIKYEIYKKENIDPEHQKLFYLGECLEDEQSLDYYGVKKEAVLIMQLSMRGGGIPAYFRTIIQNYPGTHFWKDDMIVDHLLIDFNSMIYQVISLLETELGSSINSISPINYENKLMTGIIRQLQHVICEVVRPRKSVYIAVDGPPPRAKMVQQRTRRYKSLKEQAFRKDLEKKYKINIPSIQWNKNAISPGTSFMVKLSKLIIKNIQQHTFQLHSKNLVVIFSDDSIPGEGEHKLMPSIRRMKTKGSNDVTVIYSPDADLIVLAVMSDLRNIYILREPKNSDIELRLYKDHEFLYLSIDVCRTEFCNELSSVNTVFKESYREILVDYLFLTFLCGNDFVVAAPFLRVKEGGIQILIDAYKIVFDKINTDSKKSSQFLVNSKNEINLYFLMLFLKEISSVEEDKLKHWQRKRDKIRQGIRSSKKEDNETSMEPWEVEISRFNHEEYYSPVHPHHDFLNKVFDKIDYYDPKWINMYNKHFFPEVQQIDNVCYEYFKSLDFCLKYYFDNPPSWTWYYKYRAAPTIKQMAEFIEKNIDNLSVNWEPSVPCTQFEQLMLILPRNSFKLLPKVLTIEDDLEQYYPKNFILDIIHGTKFIYSDAILPEIPLDKIRDKIKKLEKQFTQLEKERNTLRSRPYIYKTGN